MENTRLLRKALWINVAFVELMAIASFFLSKKWVAIDDLTNGQGTIMGIELLMLAGFSTYTVLKQELSRRLVWISIALHVLLIIFLATRLMDASISALGMELIVIDSLVLTALIVVQVIALQKRPVLAS